MSVNATTLLLAFLAVPPGLQDESTPAPQPRTSTAAMQIDHVWSNVINGSAYDVATIEIGDADTIELPDSSVVSVGHNRDHAVVHMRKRLAFAGLPTAPMTLEHARTFMGCALRREGRTVTLATFGEFDTIEGGADIVIRIIVPQRVQVKLLRSLRGLANSKAESSESQIRAGYSWYTGARPGAGWERVLDQPDLDWRNVPAAEGVRPLRRGLLLQFPDHRPQRRSTTSPRLFTESASISTPRF
jgi:hypothetical protein